MLSVSFDHNLNISSRSDECIAVLEAIYQENLVFCFVLFLLFWTLEGMKAYF